MDRYFNWLFQIKKNKVTMKYFKLIAILLTLASAKELCAQTNIEKKILTAEKKEQFVQKALALRKDENYSGAILQLDSILSYNNNDAPILLFKGDLMLQSKRYAEAAATYKKILPLNYEHTIVQINLSYALFMNHKPGKALEFAQQAWEQNKTNTSAIVNHFNALLWNINTTKAAAFLQQQQSLLTAAQVLVLRARLYTTSGDYTNGLKYYDSLVSSYPDKYYVQEYAEVLLGKKEISQSEQTMKTSEKLFSVNEYKVYRQKLNAAKLQNTGTEFVYFKDVAKNIRIENIAWWQQRDGRTYRFRVSAGFASLTSAQHEKTNAQFAHVTVTERWNKAWTGQTDLHLQLIQPFGSKGFKGITGKQTVQYQPNDRRMIGLSLSREILNFTASLLQKNIGSNNIGYVTHLMMSGKTGFYSQGSWGLLSDKNQNQQFFGSIYHLFRTEPTLKAGLNFSAVHYMDSSIKTYFSPNKYLSSEVFADYSTPLPNLSKFYLQLQGGAGLQKIENQQWDPAFRFQTELGLRLKHLETALKYQTSNVATSSGAGYKFNWFTFRLAWRW
jgi:tetratricopeptide (TPR) repeat protein